MKQIDIKSQIDKIRDGLYLFNRNFIVAIEDKHENLVFEPYIVSNFSVNGNKICVTLMDIIAPRCIEKTIDDLKKGFWCFKPTLTITLLRMDTTLTEIYRVVYKNCRLKNYHGKNFTYKNNEPYQWYLEFTFNGKDIQEISPIKLKEKLCVPNITDYDAKVLKNSNKMLDESINKVWETDKISEYSKRRVAREINKAKNENNKILNRKKLDELEGNLMKTIDEMEGE